MYSVNTNNLFEFLEGAEVESRAKDQKTKKPVKETQKTNGAQDPVHSAEVKSTAKKHKKKKTNKSAAEDGEPSSALDASLLAEKEAAEVSRKTQPNEAGADSSKRKEHAAPEASERPKELDNLAVDISNIVFEAVTARQSMLAENAPEGEPEQIQVTNSVVVNRVPSFSALQSAMGSPSPPVRHVRARMTAQELARKLEDEALTCTTGEARITMWQNWLRAMQLSESKDADEYVDEKDLSTLSFNTVFLRSRAIQFALQTFMESPAEPHNDGEFAMLLRDLFQLCMAGDSNTHAVLVDGLLDVAQRVRDNMDALPQNLASTVGLTVAAFTANVNAQRAFFKEMESLEARIREDEARLPQLEAQARAQHNNTAVLSKLAACTGRLVSLAEAKLREVDTRQNVFKRDEHVRRLFAHVDNDLKAILAAAENKLTSIRGQRDELVMLKEESLKRTSGETNTYRDTIAKLLEDEKSLVRRKKELDDELERVKSALTSVVDQRKRLEDEDRRIHKAHYEVIRVLDEQDRQVQHRLDRLQVERATLDHVANYLARAQQTLMDIIDKTSIPLGAVTSDGPFMYLRLVLKHLHVQLDSLRALKGKGTFCGGKLGALRQDLHELQDQGMEDVAADLTRSISRLENMAATAVQEAEAVRADVDGVMVFVRSVLESAAGQSYKVHEDEISNLLADVMAEYHALININSSLILNTPHHPPPQPAPAAAPPAQRAAQRPRRTDDVPLAASTAAFPQPIAAPAPTLVRTAPGTAPTPVRPVASSLPAPVPAAAPAPAPAIVPGPGPAAMPPPAAVMMPRTMSWADEVGSGEAWAPDDNAVLFTDGYAQQGEDTGFQQNVRRKPKKKSHESLNSPNVAPAQPATSAPSAATSLPPTNAVKPPVGAAATAAPTAEANRRGYGANFYRQASNNAPRRHPPATTAAAAAPSAPSAASLAWSPKPTPAPGSSSSATQGPARPRGKPS